MFLKNNISVSLNVYIINITVGTKHTKPTGRQGGHSQKNILLLPIIYTQA